MSQSSSDKFMYFTVGLLKNSEALEALRQDAVKHHMIDNPGQLIALRLTEYYESLSQGQSSLAATNRSETERPRTEQRQADRNSATEWRSATTNAHAATSFEMLSSTPTPTPPAQPVQPPVQSYMQPQAQQVQVQPAPQAPQVQPNQYAQQVQHIQPQTQSHSQSHIQQPSSVYASLQNSQVSGVTGRMRALLREGDSIVSTSTNADQNADEAADYWSAL
jgi:hypothetical protein